MPRRGSKKKKTRTHVVATEEEIDSVPKSIVLKRTALSAAQKLFEDELRAMMSPFTAMKLKESLRSKMKEILSTADNFGARNLFLLYEREDRFYLKIAVCPRGPTFTFRVLSFHLGRDLVRGGAKPIGALGLGAAFPIVYGFEKHTAPRAGELLAQLFEGLFPSSAHFAKSAPRRAVSIVYNAEADVVELRHYKLTREEIGLSAAVRCALSAAEFDFSAVDDAGQLLLAEGAAAGARKIRLSLEELAPRLRLRLVKIEAGLLAGEVLHHGLVQKSAEEAARLRTAAAERAARKLRERRVQAANVARKEAERAQKSEEKRRKYEGKQKANSDSLSELNAKSEESEKPIAKDAKTIAPRKRIKKAI